MLGEVPRYAFFIYILSSYRDCRSMSTKKIKKWLLKKYYTTQITYIPFIVYVYNFHKIVNIPHLLYSLSHGVLETLTLSMTIRKINIITVKI